MELGGWREVMENNNAKQLAGADFLCVSSFFFLCEQIEVQLSLAEV